MYRIKVIAPISSWNVEEGYFANCYRCRPSSEDSAATWINFISEKAPDANKIKLFKTLKEAENKVKFLKEKIDLNGYMWHWELEIEEINK